MNKSFGVFIATFFVPLIILAQNNNATKIDFIKNQSYLAQNPLTLRINDSLVGFDEFVFKTELAAHAVFGAEYVHYLEQSKRRFIVTKYGLKNSESATNLSAKIIGTNNVVNFAPCVNEGFESSAVGSYTSANAISGWSISSQTTYSCLPNNSLWTPGSSEFSIVSTPLINFPFIGNIPNSPLGGSRVARLNDFSPNQNSTRLSQTFTVTVGSSSFNFAYAGLWQDGGHNCCEQPQFRVEFVDCLGSPLNCLTFSANATATTCNYYTPSANTFTPGYAFTNWQSRSIDLSAFIGNCITVNIISSDCIFGGHYGTVFFDATCGNGLTVMNNNLNGNQAGWVNYCAGSNQAQLNAPMGYVSYQWYTPGGTPVAAPQGTTNSIVVLNPLTFPLGVYTADLTSASGCQFIASYTLSPTQVSVSAIGSTSSCIGGASGSATVQGVGSGTGYNYTWTNATNSVVSTNSVASGLLPGVYTVSLSAFGTTSNTCGSALGTVTVQTGPALTNTFLKPFCFGTAYLKIPNATTIQWYFNTAAVPLPLGAVSAFTVSSPVNNQTISVGYTSNEGCRDSTIFILAQSAPGAISIASSSLACPNFGQGSAVISMTPAIGSPSGTNSYSVWSFGPANPPYLSFVNLSSSTSFTANNLAGGLVYTVSAFDGSCYYGNTFTVNLLLPPFNFTLSPATTTLCGNTPINASVNFSVAPNTGQYAYSWTPAAFISGNSNSQNVVINPILSVGTSSLITFTAVVTPSAANCPLSKTLAVLAVNLQNPSISSVPPLCSNQGNYTVAVNPGGGVFSSSGSSGLNPVSGIITASIATPGLNSFTYAIQSFVCLASSTGTYLINTAPVLSGLSSYTICKGEQISLSVSGADAYLWSNGAGGSVILVSPLASTSYSVVGSNATNDCSDSMNISVVTNDCTGITRIEFTDENNILIYPNPNAGKFFVDLRKPCQISIYDELGRNIFYEDFKSGIQVVDLSTYSNGLYLIKIFNYKSTSFIKVLKKD